MRSQVALVIAGLSFLPNVLLALVLFVPTYNRLSEVTAAVWGPVLGWMAATALLSGGVGYLLSRQLLLSLTRLTGDLVEMRRAPARLELTRLSPDPGEPREIILLKRSFNDLLHQVTTEQSRRQAFMATLMHDLKTPLIAVNHLLGVVRDPDLPAEERTQLVGRMESENQQLISLVQKLVDALRVERDDVVLTRRTLELAPLVSRVVNRVKPLAEARGVSLSVQGSGVVSADARELERALYNLTSNAARYAERRISLELFPGLIRLSDDGPGLPAPLSELAQPFRAQPVELGGEHYTAGTGGLGLFIARRILEAHGGSLQLERSGPGGTVLLLYLSDVAGEASGEVEPT